MQWTVQTVAKAFSVSEKTVYRWIKERHLPAYRDGHLHRFNRDEVLEWAAAHHLHLSPQFLENAEKDAGTLPAFADALEAGGIFHQVAGEDKQSLMRQVVALLRLPPHVNRDFLFQVLWARESLESTAIGDGIAVPHPRNPIVLNVTTPSVTLCFPARPVDFGALDGQPVYALFTLISPTVKTHLHLLSRLAFTLRDEQFRQLLVARAGAAEILAAARRVGTRMPNQPSSPSAHP